MQGMSDEFPHDFARAARHVDLAILGQPRDGDPLIGQYALVERCLFASGRPVIIVPASTEEARAQRYGRCGMGWQRGSSARDQRRADIPEAGRARGARGGCDWRDRTRRTAPK